MPAQLSLSNDLFGAFLLPGLRYSEDFIDANEEADLIAQFVSHDLSPFRFQGWLGKRLTATFGWRYDFDSGSFAPADPIPPWLLPIRSRAAAFAGLPAAKLEQALLIKYDVGAGIGWHKDRPVFEDVVGVSLGAPAPMRFRKRLGTGFDRKTIPLAPRSIYVLAGEARHDWEHSIAALSAPRWSITFRSLSGKAAAKIAAGQVSG
jgi:DNA oxidative demethylase